MPPTLKSERSANLIEIGKRSFSEFRRKYDGRTMQVLWESKKSGFDDEKNVTGLTSNYIRVEALVRNTNETLSEVVLKFDENDPYGNMGVLSDSVPQRKKLFGF